MYGDYVNNLSTMSFPYALLPIIFLQAPYKCVRDNEWKKNERERDE